MIEPSTRDKAIIGVIAIVTLVLIIYSASNGIGAGTGFEVTSITTEPHIISPSTNLASINFLINVVFNGAGQSIAGFITQDQFEAKSTFETDFPLEIEASAVDETVTYNIINMDNAGIIPQYQCVVRTKPHWYSAKPDLCTGTTHLQWTDSIFEVTSDYRYCVYKSDIGIAGELSNPIVTFKADLTLRSAGKTATSQISTNQQSTTLTNPTTGETLAWATWSGSLVTGNAPPNPANYKAVLASGSWKVVHDYTWNNYKITLANTEQQIGNIASYTGNPCGTINSYTNTLDALLAEDVQMANDEQDRFTPEKINPSDPNSGRFSIHLDRYINYPNIVFKVKASWIGIKIPVGKPKIATIGCDDFRSGELGKITMTVNNLGSAEGNFLPSLECNPFTMAYVPSPTSIPPSQSRGMDISLNPGADNSELTKFCLVKVYDRNDPTLFDTRNVQCTRKPAVTCTPNSLRQDGSCALRCKSDGYSSEIAKCCSTGGLRITDPSPSTVGEQGEEIWCSTSPPDDCDSKWYDLVAQWKCSQTGGCAWYDIPCMLNRMKTIAGLIGGLLGFVLSLSYLRDVLKKESDRQLIIILSLLIGGLVGYAIFTAFYLGLLVLAVIVLIKIIKPF